MASLVLWWHLAMASPMGCKAWCTASCVEQPGNCIHVGNPCEGPAAALLLQGKHAGITCVHLLEACGVTQCSRAGKCGHHMTHMLEEQCSLFFVIQLVWSS
jgi:hypothetical protein